MAPVKTIPIKTVILQDLDFGIARQVAEEEILPRNIDRQAGDFFSRRRVSLSKGGGHSLKLAVKSP